MTAPVASARGIFKSFGATRALDNADFQAMPGEIHALVGENGAGKSTLVRILGGVHRPDAGEIEVDGALRRFANPHDAIMAGIATIPQELRLAPALSIAENLTLDDPPIWRVLGMPLLDRAAMREETRRALAELSFVPDPDLRIDRLSFAERQLVAIAKTLRKKCRLLILDEPTAALETREIDRLFAVLERMKVQGTAIIYVSHRLDEVVALADRCTVLRDGRVAATSRRGTFAVSDLVRAMTGRAAADTAIEELSPGDVLLEDDDIAVRAHQVVGLAGLLGSGTSRALRRMFVEPRAAIRAGIGMVPAERHLGLAMDLSVRDNILLPSLDRFTRKGVIDHRVANRAVDRLMEMLDIRPRRPWLRAGALSGGNQQKVIFAKWLAREVNVLLLDEPTQGIDIAAKAEIHAQIRALVRKGGGALVASSDLAEITRLCDRVLAMRQGRVVESIDRLGGYDEGRLHAAIGG